MGEFLSELDSVVVDLSVDQSQLDKEDAERFRKKAEVMFPKVEKAVQGLRTAADALDKVWSDGKIIRASGTSVGILGGFITLIGGIATVMTVGAATPLIASGMVIGFMGAGTNLTGRIIELYINSKEIKKAECDLKEALDSIRDVQAIIKGWLEKKDISRLRQIFTLAEAKTWSKPALKLLAVILCAATEAYKGSKAFAAPTAKAFASEAGKVGAKAAGMAGVGAAGKAGTGAAGKTGAESASKAGAKAAGKASVGATDDVIKAGAKAGKIAGGVIIGISAAFLAWDIAELGFTIRDLVENKGSDAAKDLRQKADKLENIMKRLEKEGSV